MITGSSGVSGRRKFPSGTDTIIYIIFLFYFLHLISDNIEPPKLGGCCFALRCRIVV